MSAALAKVLGHLIKALLMDPKGVLKTLFIVIIVPLMIVAAVITAPFAILTHVPLVKPGQHQDYINAVEEIEEETDVTVNWKYLMGIDAVLYKQDFSKVTKSHIEDLGWRFIREEEVLVEKTCYRTVVVVTPYGSYTKREAYDCSYYKTVYYEKSLDVVLDELVDDGLLEKAFIPDVKRYIKYSQMDETKINLDELPVVTDGTFMRPAKGIITSGFGWRWGEIHPGIDIANSSGGVPVVAIADGIVRKSYASATYGEVIIIRHNIDGEVYESLYAHMARGSRKFYSGEKVKKGDVIGVMGSTGDSTGIHLHFELHRGTWNVNKSNAINPIYEIQF